MFVLSSALLLFLVKNDVFAFHHILDVCPFEHLVKYFGNSLVACIDVDGTAYIDVLFVILQISILFAIQFARELALPSAGHFEC